VVFGLITPAAIFAADADLSLVRGVNEQIITTINQMTNEGEAIAKNCSEKINIAKQNAVNSVADGIRKGKEI